MNVTKFAISKTFLLKKQCFGSGSGWIRIIGPDPDPLHETLIRIRVAKNNHDNFAYKSTKYKYNFFFKKSLILFNIRE